MITVGKIGRPFGIQGWSVLHSFTDPIDNLIHYVPWTLVLNHTTWTLDTPAACKEHTQNKLITQLPNCKTPEQAAKWTQALIQVPDDALPELPANTYYHKDLISLDVTNQNNEHLGIVTDVVNYGPHDILVISKQKQTLMIPYLPHTITKVDLAKKDIQVDWLEPED